MTNLDVEQLEKIYSEHEANLKELAEVIVNAKKQLTVKKSWEPKERDSIYSVYWLGDKIKSGMWSGNDMQALHFDLGMIHQTLEQAEKHATYLKAVKKWNDRAEELNDGWKPERNDSKYAPCFEDGKTDYTTDNDTRYWPFKYVKSSDLCEKLISELRPELEIIFNYCN